MAQRFEESINGVTVCHISGSLTLAGMAAVEARFNVLASRTIVRVVADIGQVDAITTPAISLMLRTAWAVEERGGMMVFANATPAIRRIVECCRLDNVPNFASDVATAVNIVQSAHPMLILRFVLPDQSSVSLPLDTSGGRFDTARSSCLQE